MVSRNVLLITAAAATAVISGALLPVTSAWPNNHVVGDFRGWRLGVNYNEWAVSVEIKAGDTLQFVYPAADHNVVRVNEDGYNDCDVTNNLGMWNTGNDYVQLPNPDKYFFLCGMGDHCNQGMKVAVTAT